MSSTLKIIFIGYCFIVSNCLRVNSFKLVENCGTPHSTQSDITSNVVGGSDAAPGEFPWQVILNYNFDGDETDNCGATIITENWVLTAAHCVKDMPDKDKYKIRLGVHNRTAHEESEVVIKAQKLIQHEHYKPNITLNDIALIKMSETLDFKGKHKHLAPICLPNTSTKATDKCVATGFGLNEKQRQPQILQKVAEPIDEDSVCATIYSPVYNSTVELCGGSGKGKGVCTGDSGGPLQCVASDGKWYQFGITSYGGTCGDNPDVFVKVISFADWIEKTITNN